MKNKPNLPIRYGGSMCDDREYKAVMKSVKANKGWFKKGHKPLMGIEKGWIKEGQRLSPKTEFKKGETLADKNVLWKGDEASYQAKHMWIYSRLGKPHDCQQCGNKKLRHRQYHWANISGNYKRVLSDWIRLCAKCHWAFDRK